MKGNVCPVCGKEVMPYKRFILEAEPYKTSPCGSCGAPLKRHPMVFPYLLVCMLLCAAALVGLMAGGYAAHHPSWLIVTYGLVFFAASVILINYFAWRFIGWLPAEGAKAGLFVNPFGHTFQWKWVGLGVVMYIVFYLLPLFAIGGRWNDLISPAARHAFVGTWTFAGAFVVGAVAAYLSRGVTILEPALASVVAVIMWVIAFVNIMPSARFTISRDLMPTLVILAVIFFLAVIGAYYGEALQKSRKAKEE